VVTDRGLHRICSVSGSLSEPVGPAMRRPNTGRARIVSDMGLENLRRHGRLFRPIGCT